MNGAATRGMKLDDNVVRSMARAKVFKENVAPINSVDFTTSGDWAVTTSDDDSIRVYNCLAGTLHRTLYSKKYGCSTARFTHHSNNIIYASKNGWDETIRYHSLHDNRYLMYFKGHRESVVSLSMSPSNDTFLSGSVDKTVRMWDLRTPLCQGLLRSTGPPAVAYDPDGLVFAVSYSNAMRLYDPRSFDNGPFATFIIEGPRFESSHIKFSPDGKNLLLATNEKLVVVLDAFNGDQRHTFTNLTNNYSIIQEASWSPDSQYILAGSSDGTIHVWSVITGNEVAVWEGHPGPVSVVKWSPRASLVASGCTNLVLWLPTPPTSDQQQQHT
ncbi:Wdr82 protein [Pelomyxa schiedti]|nr:Wdr82 protein [Pelomyxa schiedti]